MGRISSINTGFWTSPQVVDNFTPEERYVYLYCLTNPRTNLCGCYEVSIKTIAFETGMERYEVRDILDLLQHRHGVICYDADTRELFISGQYQLWDEAAKVVATSAGSINSALESQITYWQDYNANLQSLTDRSADIEGLSDMIASFADGSSDSVNAIAGMAGATDEQLATMVANWKTLQQEQQNAAGSVADLKTDFTATMDELQAALAEDIEAMDLGDEAKASAQATIQGFIDGAVGMLPQVTAAYNRVAAAARAALSASGTGTAGSIPGYAVGTQSAAPGFALVGENGPELVYFNGGEQVMTAEETAAMRESMEIQAITFAPQLLEAMHAIQGDGALSASLPGQSSELPPIIIENTFHVEGNATPETIAALADYGDSLKEVVREAIAEIEEDVSRTMYR